MIMDVENQKAKKDWSDGSRDTDRYRTGRNLILYAEIVERLCQESEIDCASLDRVHREYCDSVADACSRTTRRYLRTLNELGIVEWRGKGPVKFNGWPGV